MLKSESGQWPFGELPAEHIARLMRVSISTARRWRRRRSLPEPFSLLAHILIRGDLGLIDPVWSGWSIRNGELHSPLYRRPFTVSEMAFLAFNFQRTAALEEKVRALESERACLPDSGPFNEQEQQRRDAALRAIGRAEILVHVAREVVSALQQPENGSLRQHDSDTRAVLKAAQDLVGKLSEQNGTQGRQFGL